MNERTDDGRKPLASSPPSILPPLPKYLSLPSLSLSLSILPSIGHSDSAPSGNLTANGGATSVSFLTHARPSAADDIADAEAATAQGFMGACAAIDIDSEIAKDCQQINL